MMANVEFETVSSIVAGLNAVKIGIEKLCSRNRALLTAEGAFSSVIGELNEQNSELGKDMKNSVIQRINEKRNVNLIGLMQYLNFRRKYKSAAVTIDISRLPEEESMEILKEILLTLDKILEKEIYSKTKVLYCSTKKNTIFNKITKRDAVVRLD
ncbi:uncharacterized protein TNCV_2926601 [Trichonephila clavipes]|nr:uncharacterized protein TNCV_2926601 [Trichonephila clavipes]